MSKYRKACCSSLTWQRAMAPPSAACSLSCRSCVEDLSERTQGELAAAKEHFEGLTL